jgi:GntR family transcriptional regulator/MocR family aminotransferase
MAVCGGLWPLNRTMPLSFTLDPTETGPLFLQIAARLRAAITGGQILPGARLPSARALAVQLSVAPGTVDAAYAVLAGEGAVRTGRSAGTVVSGAVGTRIEMPEHTPFMFPGGSATEKAAPLPLRIGLPALGSFPIRAWSKQTIHAVRGLSPDQLADPDPCGLPELRRAVAAYLGRARGVACAPEQVLITAGYQGALALVRSVLVKHGDPVWIEDPAYPPARQALEAAGARIVPVRVDQDGMRVAAGKVAAPRARLAVVTPTHQYPTGAALSLPRRMELLAWAADADARVLEDDYDSEFRYAGRPLPALKSLDRGQRVLYAGSFSKVLFPALRLGYLVVPPELAAAFVRAAALLTAGQPPLQQSVVAAFMASGQFARHIKRMRALYGERRQALTAALEDAGVTVEAPPGGMHLLARCSGTDNDSVLARRAAAAGLAPAALSPLALAHDCGQGLLLGFANVPAAEAEAVVARLLAAIRGHPSASHPLPSA